VAGTLDLATFPVQAQTTTTTKIVITDARIPTRDLISNSPLMTLGQEQIQQTGTTQVEQLLNFSPKFSPGLTLSLNNSSSGGGSGGGAGSARVDVSGFGTTRWKLGPQVKRGRSGSTCKQGTLGSAA